MKKILFITIVLSIFMSLNAKEIFVKVTSVGYHNLFNTLYGVKELGYKAHTLEDKDLYKIYAGPFKNNTDARRALSVIQKRMFKSASLVLLVNAKEIKYKTTIAPSRVKHSSKSVALKKVDVSDESHKNLNSKSNDFFIALNIGIAMPTVDESPNDVNFDSENGLSFTLEGGYYFTNNLFMTLDYQHADLNDLVFDNIYTKLDYQFDEMYIFSPYLGVILGYGMMGWNSYIDTSDKANSFITGAEIATDIDLTDNLALVLSYSYWMIDYTTTYKVEDITNEISHKGQQNLNVGIKYRF